MFGIYKDSLCGVGSRCMACLWDIDISLDLQLTGLSIISKIWMKFSWRNSLKFDSQNSPNFVYQNPIRMGPIAHQALRFWKLFEDL